MLFPIVNRSLLVARPRQPYIDWANRVGTGPELTAEEAARDTSAYLVDVIESDDDVEAIVARHFGDIFENELNGWCTLASAWPQERSLTLFREWFDVSWHSSVSDLSSERLALDE